MRRRGVPGIEQLAGPGGFNDLDMLMVFNPKAHLSPVEDASHLALWAIFKSPLLPVSSLSHSLSLSLFALSLFFFLFILFANLRLS